MHFRIFGLLFFCLLPHFVSAQIVNIEDRRSNHGDTIAWFGAAGLGFNLVENGDGIITFRGDIAVEYQHLRHLFLSFSNFNLVRIEDKDFINDGFQHFRYNYRLNQRITLEAFTQAQYNERIRLRVRGLLGIGPRFSFLKPGKQKIYLGVLYMYEYGEEKESLDQPDLITYHYDNRLSNYLALRFQLGKQTTIASTSYYQPVITDPDDFRLSSQTQIVLAITEKLGFRTTFSITYDTRVPESVPNTIYRWTNGLKLSF